MSRSVLYYFGTVNALQPIITYISDSNNPASCHHRNQCSPEISTTTWCGCLVPYKGITLFHTDPPLPCPSLAPHLISQSPHIANTVSNNFGKKAKSSQTSYENDLVQFRHRNFRDVLQNRSCQALPKLISELKPSGPFEKKEHCCIIIHQVVLILWLHL